MNGPGTWLNPLNTSSNVRHRSTWPRVIYVALGTLAVAPPLYVGTMTTDGLRPPNWGLTVYAALLFLLAHAWMHRHPPFSRLAILGVASLPVLLRVLHVGQGSFLAVCAFVWWPVWVAYLAHPLKRG